MNLGTLIAECTAYDFKVMLEEKRSKSWLKSVSAFANGLGGSLFFGIDNDGVIKDRKRTVCDSTSLLYDNMKELICTLFILEKDWISNLSFCTIAKCKDG